MFLAIMSATPEQRVYKYAEFANRGLAEAHVARFTDDFPQAFVELMPGTAPFSHWRIDMDAQTLIVDSTLEQNTSTDSDVAEAIRAVAEDVGPATVAKVDAILGPAPEEGG